MSRHVDENLIRMRFDNHDFNRNIDSSDAKLKGFSQTINSLPSSIEIGLKGLLANTSLGDILNFAAVTTGIGVIKSEIASIATPIETVAQKAMTAVSNVITNTINQINTGGKQRALDIAQAKFQIEGLKLDVDTFMEASNYAVEGTAYGLNEAAKVAAQLGASGVTELGELKKALRAVSGVAAMTSRSYSDMGHIFTVIASNGKLMTEQIRSFSYAGLNVSEKLAKYLGVTESEIEDLVKHGEISFKTFYEAMDEAFGEHAKDANKTFTGALDNIKAALNRIGEKLWTPIIDNSIGLFNELRLTINAFKQELEDNAAFEVFGNSIKKILENVSNMVKLIKYAITETGAVEEVADFFKNLFLIAENAFDAFSIDYGFVINEIIENLSTLFNVVKRLMNMVNRAIDEVYGIRKLGGDFNSLILWVSRLSKILLEVFNNKEDGIYNTIKSWLNALKEVYVVVVDILGINRTNLEDIFRGAVDAILTLFENLKITDDRLDKIKRTFSGVASAIDILRMLLVSLFDSAVKPILSYVEPLGDTVLDITANIGDYITNLRNSIKEGNTFDVFFQGLIEKIKDVLELASKFGGKFLEIFFGDNSEEEKPKTFFGKILAFFGKVIEFIKSIFEDLNIAGLDLSPIQKLFDNIANLGFGESAKKTESFKEKSEKFADNFQSFMNTLTVVFVLLDDFLVLVAEKTGFEERLREANNALTIALGIVYTILYNFISEINKIISSFSQMDSSDKKDVLISLIENVANVIITIWTDMKKIVQAIAIGGPLALNLGKFVTTLGQTIYQLAEFVKMLFSPGDFIGSIFKPFQNFIKEIGKLDLAEIIHGKEKVSDVLKAIALVIFAIAAALFVIAIIPVDQLNRTVGAFAAVVGLIFSIFGVIFILSKIFDGFNSMNANLNLKNGFKSLKDSITTISTYNDPLNAIGKLFKAIGATLLEISAAIYVITKAQSKGNIWSSFGMISAILVVITGIIVGLEALQTKAKMLDPLGIVSIGTAFLMIGGAIALIGVSLHMITDGNSTKRMWAALGVVTVLMVVVGGIIAAISVLTKSNMALSVLAGVGVLLAFVGLAAAIQSVCGLLKVISKIPATELEASVAALDGILVVLGIVSAVIMFIGMIAGSAAPASSLVLLAFAGDLLMFALLIAALALPLLAIVGIMNNLQKIVTAWADVVNKFADMDDSQADKIGERFKRVASTIGEGIGSAVKSYHLAMLNGFTDEIFPSVLSFIETTLSPFLKEAHEKISPIIVENIASTIALLLKALSGYGPDILDCIETLLFRTDGVGIIGSLFIYLDRIWDSTIDWMKGRIPIWVVDVISIILILIKSINDTLEENWEDLDSELQRLIDNTLKLLGDLITGEKTMNEVGQLLGTLLDHIVTVLDQNEDKIKEAFKEFGRILGESLFAGIKEALPDELVDGIDALGGLFNGKDEEDFDPSRYLSNSNIAKRLRERVPGSINDINPDLLNGINNGIDLVDIVPGVGGNNNNDNGILDKVTDIIGGLFNSTTEKKSSVDININNKSDPNAIYNTTASIDKMRRAAGLRVMSN